MPLALRIFAPLVVLLLVAIMSGAFMYSVGGATNRMKIVFRYAMLFVGGVYYCIVWRDNLANLFGYEDAWITISVGFFLLSTALCGQRLKKQAAEQRSREHEQEESSKI